MVHRSLPCRSNCSPPRWFPAWLPGVCLLVVGMGDGEAARAAEKVWTTQQLVNARPEWDRLLNTRLRVEGRLASHSRRQLRLTKCDLTFRLTEEQESQVGAARNLELSGKLMRDRETGRIFFEVATLKPLPTDRGQLLDREARLKNPKAKDWYDLAQWADERGRFYEDAELLATARTYYSRGLILEWRDVPRDDFPGKFRLLSQAREWQLPAELEDELRHEVFRAWWQRAAAADNPHEEWSALLARLAADWPAAFLPLPEWPADLVEAYDQDPLGTYRKADEQQRHMLQRIFTGQVQIKEIVAVAAKEGHDSLEIARQIESLVPERRALAEQYRDREYQRRLKNVETLSKAELLELAQLFRERNNPDIARQALRQWLAARVQRLGNRGGAPERLALADDYWSLLGDEAATVALLEAARQFEPESEDVQKRFRELGYRWNGNRWTKAPTAESGSAAPAPTQLVTGLTAEEVQHIQGRPTRKAILVSAQGTEEYWIYGDGDGSRLVVHLQRRVRQNELRVVRIFQR
uniref:Uncharacterized protein n=1 Tax=Schlesneria paludicola TaxID=360056 RepID=A0A7C4LKM0_9PLAN